MQILRWTTLVLVILPELDVAAEGWWGSVSCIATVAFSSTPAMAFCTASYVAENYSLLYFNKKIQSSSVSTKLLRSLQTEQVLALLILRKCPFRVIVTSINNNVHFFFDKHLSLV